MASSSAKTVTEYLASLPADRAKVVGAVRDEVRRNLPNGYEESMLWGMISYTVPLSRYSDTYNDQPLGYAAIAAQKSYYAVYLMGVYGDTERATKFSDAFTRAGKKLDMGKSCVRFKGLDDIPLSAIGDAIAGMSVDDYIDYYEKSRPQKPATKTAKKKPVKKAVKKPAKRSVTKR